MGRSEREGEVVVQTDSLDSFLVNCVLRKDYEAFVRQELEARAELGYPPFEHFVRLVFSARDEKKVQETAGRVYRRLKAMLSQRKAVFEVTVPTPRCSKNGKTKSAGTCWLRRGRCRVLLSCCGRWCSSRARGSKRPG